MKIFLRLEKLRCPCFYLIFAKNQKAIAICCFSPRKDLKQRKRTRWRVFVEFCTTYLVEQLGVSCLHPVLQHLHYCLHYLGKGNDYRKKHIPENHSGRSFNESVKY